MREILQLILLEIWSMGVEEYDILPALKYGVSCSLKVPIPSLQRGF